jgi:toxin secretion/phage lysis holin|uniref:Holin n=1 Tax=Siphoviridae sp. ctFiA6 TaxID=2823573 RepID=A0A8S5LGM3_9CAUD|nr:MAG TPA: holin [Siphoviridae sp. ctFiA6]
MYKNMKDFIQIVTGGLGGLIITLAGGFDLALRTLIIFMIIDYITGMMVAGLFNKSKKSEHGSLSSAAGWKGLAKKVSTVFMIVVAFHLDRVLKVDYIRNAVCVGFIVNEGLSILENYSLMGGTGAEALKKALDILKSKKDESTS